MSNSELHLELLLGKKVLDSAGEVVGRIEEIYAEQQDNEWVIQEYLVGSAALIERLSAWRIGISILKVLGARKFQGGYRIPWHKLDLANPEEPRLLCTCAELAALNQEIEPAEQPQAAKEG